MNMVYTIRRMLHKLKSSVLLVGVLLNVLTANEDDNILDNKGE